VSARSAAQWTDEFLSGYLTKAGFTNIRRVDELGLFDDTSTAATPWRADKSQYDRPQGDTVIPVRIACE
jgi:hypothetical protein